MSSEAAQAAEAAAGAAPAPIGHAGAAGPGVAVAAMRGVVCTTIVCLQRGSLRRPIGKLAEAASIQLTLPLTVAMLSVTIEYFLFLYVSV